MKSSFFTKIATTAGFVLGAFALSALAGTWTAPTAPAPGGNPDAPINVGSLLQNKLGWLGVKGLVTTDLTLATGTPVAGQVLTAIDSLGNAKWQTLPVGTSPKIYSIPSLSLQTSTFATSRSISYYVCTTPVNNGCSAYGPLQTTSVATAFKWNGQTYNGYGTTMLHNDSVTLNKFCETLFPDAPYVGSYNPKPSWNSPEDNGILYWSTTKNAFVAVEANHGMNNGVSESSSSFQCTSIESVVLN